MPKEKSSRKRPEPAQSQQGGDSCSAFAPATGVDALIAGVSRRAAQACAATRSTSWFVRSIAADYANIQLDDWRRPIRFLRQMEGAPPLHLGTEGFRTEIVDDLNPARHYIAFVFIGFYLPGFTAEMMLWLWEVASFVRYRGVWSWPDIASGRIGIAHGRLVRRYGPTVLPGLIAHHMAAR